MSRLGGGGRTMDGMMQRLCGTYDNRETHLYLMQYFAYVYPPPITSSTFGSWQGEYIPLFGNYTEKDVVLPSWSMRWNIHNSSAELGPNNPTNDLGFTTSGGGFYAFPITVLGHNGLMVWDPNVNGGTAVFSSPLYLNTLTSMGGASLTPSSNQFSAIGPFGQQQLYAHIDAWCVGSGQTQERSINRAFGTCAICMKSNAYLYFTTKGSTNVVTSPDTFTPSWAGFPVIIYNGIFTCNTQDGDKDNVLIGAGGRTHESNSDVICGYNLEIDKRAAISND